jgi:hypothetical protein
MREWGGDIHRRGGREGLENGWERVSLALERLVKNELRILLQVDRRPASCGVTGNRVMSAGRSIHSSRANRGAPDAVRALNAL